jgi:inositol oxygenase
MSAIFNRQPGEAMNQAIQTEHRDRFVATAVETFERHFRQNQTDIRALKAKYDQPVIGQLSAYEAMEKLALCIDPSDVDLACVSQLTHCLQVAEAMRRDRVAESVLVVGLIHDIGKLLLLAGEAPEHVSCPNELVQQPARGGGLDRAVTHWNHDEYAFSRLSPHLSREQAWLVRYHSLRFDGALAAMSEEDRDLYHTWLVPFRRYDLGTKSVWFRPRWPLRDYRGLLDDYFPESIGF